MKLNFKKYAPAKMPTQIKISGSQVSIGKADRDALGLTEGYLTFYYDNEAKVMGFTFSKGKGKDAVKLSRGGTCSLTKVLRFFDLTRHHATIDIAWNETEKKFLFNYPPVQLENVPIEKPEKCDRCDGEGTIHDADFSDGDSDQQMYLMQDTLRPCPKCRGSGEQLVGT